MIDITNIVNVSVSTAPAGLAPYSVNNVAVFTKDTPVVALSGSYGVYTNPTDVNTQWGSSSATGVAGTAIFTQSPNILTGGGVLLVIPMVGDETLAEAFARMKDTVFFGAFGHTFAADQTEVVDAATAAHAAGRFYFVVSADADDLAADGLIKEIYDASLTKGRCLLHTVSAQKEKFKWGYIGRAMSVNFAGDKTMQTMNLKQIAGCTADTGLTATILTAAKAVGADLYASIAGRASVLSHGANQFFDYEYGLMWLINALEVATFNQLAQTSTKIPQTEAGMDSLKGAQRKICEQAVKNGFAAPGTWTGTDRFGDPEDFDRNILERGYYIYSAPISEQATADREARIAPVTQIAIKTAGAFHSANVIVYVNK